MITLYGITNCDTVKRARKTLETAGIEYRFHDFRRDGLSPDQTQAWLDTLGADQLINRRGTTWRKLEEGQRSLADRDAAIQLLLAQPSLIKRPVFEHGGALRIGFARQDEADIIAWLKS